MASWSTTRNAWRRRCGLGIAPGDHVALVVPNVPWFPVAYFGILKAGAVVVPLNVLLKPREIAYHLKDSDAKALIAFEGTAELPLARWRTPACDEAGCPHLLIMTLTPPRRARSPGCRHCAAMHAASRAVPDPAAAPGRHRGDPLHVRHDRSAEGRGADAREHGAQRRGHARHVPAGDARRLRTGGRARHAAALPLDRADLPDERRASTAASASS